MDDGVMHVPEGNRYELHREGRVVGRLDYTPAEGTLVVTHTEISPAMRGRGLGDVLVRGALDDVRARGLRVRPLCWFVRDVMRLREEYRDLLSDRDRAAFGL
jgi:uncharacterized protein